MSSKVVPFPLNWPLGDRNQESWRLLIKACVAKITKLCCLFFKVLMIFLVLKFVWVFGFCLGEQAYSA